ncbi:hypothetical protein [Bradyrhizobium guangzhouense]|uniref:PH domain-containing protein n=1 Tax=Bradyrhizobium guangzhouense TaxID=1325095 RepID=A0AAE5X0L7_9BRAD|nr:hypothetical protein [Bradyrhizobium guangzhouense]QAU46618.1 hypothetical protein XH91_15440 [Bradyrhizobium guangzhouense]RXH08572.1 hypothetical protein EAS54_35540 [Bradyrhizobium guangzhouense]RXH10427.1 hypothetical protein EAS56_22445 [Bradyrhizobium guangzhouense]
MLNQRLNAHYSVLALLSRAGFCGGLAVMFWFVAAYMRGQIWFTVVNYILATTMAGAAFTLAYLLLTAKDEVVVSIDATGFKHTRLTPTAIPWNVIQSVTSYIPYKSWNKTGVLLVMNPAFQQKLSIRPAERLLAWTTGYSISGSVIRLDASILDTDSDEISRVANSYISDRS